MISMIPKSWSVSKSINGQLAIHMGTYYSLAEAEAAARDAAAFHRHRCPKDHVEMFIREN